MRVTIIADASFCPETYVGGYGYWIASDRGKEGGGGAFKGLLLDNNVAEMQAIVNALYIAIRLNLVCKNDSVLLQTDCTSAIHAFTGKRLNLNKQELETVRKFRSIGQQFKLTLVFMHVRGHTRIKDARHITNNMCDLRAKEAMRKARAKVKNPSESN